MKKRGQKRVKLDRLEGYMYEQSEDDDFSRRKKEGKKYRNKKMRERGRGERTEGRRGEEKEGRKEPCMIV